jgi:hypothetical protein
MIDIEKFTDILENNKSFFKDFTGKSISIDNIAQFKNEFEKIYELRPVVDNSGGGGPIPSFWYYLIARHNNPELIVESGVWKGHTTWVFRKATPEAKIISFDISFKNLKYKDDFAEYCEYDWNDYDFGTISSREYLLFLDDHINHAKRIIEAYNKGFKYIILDDGNDIQQGLNLCQPAFPSVQMFFNNELKYGETYSYKCKDEERFYLHNKDEIEPAKKLVKDYLVLSNTYTCITLVILNDR